jgi:predicted RNase H-like nuclease (RuvC/YqgF family)
MENMKLPIALVAAMAVQLAGAVWWVSQQAATISSLEENVEQFASRMAVENTVNLKRDVQESKSDIAELWEDSDEVWEEMGAMLATFSSINDLKQRIALLETELKYMNRDHNKMLMHNDGM